jgi:hypothetical protein
MTTQILIAGSRNADGARRALVGGTVFVGAYLSLSLSNAEPARTHQNNSPCGRCWPSSDVSFVHDDGTPANGFAGVDAVTIGAGAAARVDRTSRWCSFHQADTSRELRRICRMAAFRHADHVVRLVQPQRRAERLWRAAVSVGMAGENESALCLCQLGGRAHSWPRLECCKDSSCTASFAGLSNSSIFATAPA